MSLNLLTEILDKIGSELTPSISLAKNIDKIDIKTLSQQSKTLNGIILTSEISKEYKSMLQKFSLTLQEGITVVCDMKNKIFRVMSNLNN